MLFQLATVVVFIMKNLSFYKSHKEKIQPCKHPTVIIRIIDFEITNKDWNKTFGSLKPYSEKTSNVRMFRFQVFWFTSSMVLAASFAFPKECSAYLQKNNQSSSDIVTTLNHLHEQVFEDTVFKNTSKGQLVLHNSFPSILSDLYFSLIFIIKIIAK